MPPETSAAARAEQGVVTTMYQRLDHLTERASKDLARARRSPTAGTPAAQVEREALIRTYSQRLGALVSAERRLCFGRLDFSAGGTPVYIGRLSLADEEQSLLLTDWRASVAEPFYRATTATPMGIARRRHILLRGREVSAVEDDVLDLDAVDVDSSFEGNGALMAALASRRTGRMGDIVATIQAEQDRIIRAPMPGILVVEGGPGCGKTVVGLHRAAYLLYTHRDQVARRGVLVVGPNGLFLRYISQVLPGLGESSAVLATPGQLFPGVDAGPEPDDAVATLKGDLRMAEVVATAIRNRQRVPASARRLVVDGTHITLNPTMVNAARDRARSSRRPHNRARLTFVTSLLDRLAVALAEARGVDPEANRDLLLADLRDSPDVRREVNLCWMPLTPQKVVADLWGDPSVLEAAAPRLSDVERARLVRPPDQPWTASDVPLLDEAAELLGEDDEPARRAAAAAAAERAAEEEYARGVLEMTGVATLTAGALIERYGGSAAIPGTVVDSALEDRTWTYGHIVVDEAQELSAMQWRMLLRRCPSRSMTVVGDLAQGGSAAAAASWGDVFERVARGRWSVQSLTVNYRTPAPLMQLACDVLRASGSDVTSPSSVRDGRPPDLVRIPRDSASGHPVSQPRALAEAVVRRLSQWIEVEEGTAAVITTRALHGPVARWLSDQLPAGTVGADSASLDARVSVLTVAQAKGLEFDHVAVLEPGAIAAASSRGGHDLYVALTRATRELVVIHTEDLPPGFPSEVDTAAPRTVR